MKHNKYKLCLILIIIANFTHPSYALTLNEAIDNGLANNNSIKQKDAKISSLKTEKYQKFEEVFLPSVSLNYSQTKNNLYSNDAKENNLEVAYNVSQLYKGSLGFYGGLKVINSRILNINIEKNTFVIDVAKLYLQILEIEKTIEVLKKSLEMNKATLNQTANKVKSGSLSASSLYLIEVKVEQIESDIEYQKNQLNNAKSNFYSKIGLKPINLVEPQLKDINYNNLESFTAAVKKNNISIQSLQNQYSASKYDLTYKTSEFLPDLTLSYKKYSSTDITNKKQNGSQISLNLKFYLYKPGLISDVIEKSYLKRAANFELKNAIDTKIQKAQELWALNEYHKKTIKSKTKILKVRELIVNEKRQDYLYGRTEISSILDEEQKRIDAELELIKIKFDKIINIYEMKSLVGEKLYQLN